MSVSVTEEAEEHRDRAWRRDPEHRVETAQDAEGFVEEVGFAWGLLDARTLGPSLYVAVCGRRDARLPRNVQKDPEASHAWVLKDEVMRRGRVYYAKLIRGRSMFVARRLVPAFNAVWGLPRKQEGEELTEAALAILKVLRKEWEMGTADLRRESGVSERAAWSRAIDELQRRMKVVPGQVLYEPKFTYIYELAEGRFGSELKQKWTRERAVKAIALAYLTGAGMTLRGELSRVTGLPRWETGRANHALVDEGFAERVAEGVYRLRDAGG